MAENGEAGGGRQAREAKSRLGLTWRQQVSFASEVYCVCIVSSVFCSALVLCFSPSFLSAAFGHKNMKLASNSAEGSHF